MKGSQLSSRATYDRGHNLPTAALVSSISAASFQYYALQGRPQLELLFKHHEEPYPPQTPLGTVTLRSTAQYLLFVVSTARSDPFGFETVGFPFLTCPHTTGADTVFGKVRQPECLQLFSPELDQTTGNEELNAKPRIETGIWNAFQSRLKGSFRLADWTPTMLLMASVY